MLASHALCRRGGREWPSPLSNLGHWPSSGLLSFWVPVHPFIIASVLPRLRASGRVAAGAAPTLKVLVPIALAGVYVSGAEATSTPLASATAAGASHGPLALYVLGPQEATEHLRGLLTPFTPAIRDVVPLVQVAASVAAQVPARAVAVREALSGGRGKGTTSAVPLARDPARATRAGRRGLATRVKAHRVGASAARPAEADFAPALCVSA